MREYPLRYAGTDRIKKSHYNTRDTVHMVITEELPASFPANH